MSNVSARSSSSGIGFVGLLTIVFITLKLLGKITWPWIWVISPIWITIILFIVIIAILGIAWTLKESRKTKRRRK
jgi:uncharacterized membrane protein YqjE